MKVRNNIVVSKIRFNSLPNVSLFEMFSNRIYSEKDGFGFKDVQMENEKIKATLIKRSQTYINEFNVVTNSFEKANIAIFSEIKFIIDIGCGFLYIFGSSSSSNKLKSVFRNLFCGINYTLSNFEITAANLFDKLINN